MNCMLMKRLDVIWKGIADTVATLFVYIYGVTIFGRSPGKGVELKVSLIFAIIFLVLGYVLSKMQGPPKKEEGGKVQPK